jgi:diadenosine tetraphosphate (Ap4A) HIT family hydrolase
MLSNCVLCREDGGELIFRNDLFRVVYVDDKNYPGFVRIILNRHIKEMSDLSDEDNLNIFSALIKIEKTLRFLYKPDKINLASLGNVVPHLHWHIIPRYKNDLHFPNPIWGEIINHEYKPSDAISELKPELIDKISIICS